MSLRFGDLKVGHGVVTHSRTITEADVRNFAGSVAISTRCT